MSSWSMAPLPWQQATAEQVEAMISADRLPHALLFSGSSGIGKQSFLQQLAARILCANPSQGLACGQCRSCELLAAGSHGDCLQVLPEEGSRLIKIDQVRALIDFAAKTPALGARKVILLGPADVMNLNAANALLKCLEEPSASTVILLFSHRPGGIPATVRSRCQQIAMTTPDESRVLPWLSRLTGDESAARSLLEVTGSRPLAASALFDEGGLEQQLALREALMALGEGRLSPLQFPDLVSDMDLEAVLSMLQTHLERAIRVASTSGGSAPDQALFGLRDDIARQKLAVARGANPNRQLIIEDCATRLSSVMCAPGS